MTMPHLMNCSHKDDGWCLDCVGELWALYHAANNDALERASLRAWALLPEAHNSRIQTAIRAMKVLT